MFTYLNPSAEAKTQDKPTPPPTDDQLTKFKREMIAVPFHPNMVVGLSAARARGRGKNQNRVSNNQLKSQSYNIIAGRPISDRTNKSRTYTAFMRSTGSLLTSSASVPTFGALNFTIANFSDSAPYLALFDQYKFLELEVWIETQAGPSNSSGNAGILTTAIDLDDSTTPTTFSSVEAHQSSLTGSAFGGHYHKWVPHMAIAAYSGAFTSYSNTPATWIDSSSSSVQHYGIKGSASTAATGVVILYEVRAKVAFRQSGV